MHKKQSVFGLVFSEDRSQVLLIKRRDIPVWVLPGGGVNSDETPEDAVVREMKEETGCDVGIIRKYATYLPVNSMTTLTYGYECALKENTFALGDETLGIAFFPLNDLPKLPPPYRGWIEDGIAVSEKMIEKKIEGVTYFILLKLLLAHPILVSRYLLTKVGIHLNAK